MQGMNVLIRGLALFLLLCTCGPAQTETDPTERGVRRAEAVFNSAYQELDAAVLDRLLTDDFTLRYTEQEGSLSKEDFLGTLAELRAVFPALEVSADSSNVAVYQEMFIVRGTRTFAWQLDGQAMAHQEEYTNRWRLDDGKWKLWWTEITQLPVR